MPPEALSPASVPEREPSLLDDLLETSESLYHKSVTGKQLELHKRLEETVCRARAWLKEEMAKPGARSEFLNYMLWGEMQRFKGRLKEELHAFMDQAQVEREERDLALYLQLTPFVDVPLKQDGEDQH